MNAPQLHPYLNFNGTCRAAMTFYQHCLGGELRVQSFADVPETAQLAAKMPDGVMHSTLVTDQFTLMAADAGTEPATRGTMMALSLNCSSPGQIRQLFDQLAAGGTVTMPLQDTFWNATFGMLTDQFGIDWLLNYDKAQ